MHQLVCDSNQSKVVVHFRETPQDGDVHHTFEARQRNSQTPFFHLASVLLCHEMKGTIAAVNEMMCTCVANETL